MVQVEKSSDKKQSPETYLGTERRANYKVFPSELMINEWTLEQGTSPLKNSKLSDYWQEDADSILSKK